MPLTLSEPQRALPIAGRALTRHVSRETPQLMGFSTAFRARMCRQARHGLGGAAAHTFRVVEATRLLEGGLAVLFRKRRSMSGAGRGTGRLRQRGHDDMSVARKIGDVDRMIGGTQKGPLVIRDEWG